ncbi:RrF2 family transcriptional regulator [Mitsuokella sp. oral taxon 131]|uniref:RrF2 family transcriptional regulator n=1 Tax=Mitsuokella sp. oral taxon 131 TaxID=1321780 RepID=UPI0003AE0B57|nr:Rrf2 family transcriptional regulator [Mitsuokella sp. oral taxon 131]ERL05467.1 putative HTH-type transcriptional regulator CymR [Mitsuokella sp. oral taxon 131 str. W9106]
MKISAKGRYGLAAMTYLAQHYAAATPVTIISISENLGISKIYLEQVFALLKRAGLVNSIKGSQGGYQLAENPRAITAYDILSAIELSLMEKAAPSSPDKMPELDRALVSRVFEPLDRAIHEALASVTLDMILTAIAEEKSAESLMYFI